MSQDVFAGPRTRGETTWDFLTKVAAILAVFVYWTVGYKLTNEWCANSARAIRFIRPYDVRPTLIQPWTAVIYVFGGFSIPFLPFLYNWEWRKLGFVLRVYLICGTFSFVVYALLPTVITRPPYVGEGIGERLMRWVLSLDDEANCCPSSHTYFAIMAAMLVVHGGAPRPVSVAVWALAVAICISTVTTGQHYFIDVPGGVVTAVASFYAALWLESGRRTEGEKGAAARAEPQSMETLSGT